MQEAGRRRIPIKIAVYSDFAGFDPYNSGMDLDKVVSAIYSTVCCAIMTANMKMYCAKDYSISEDGTEYTFSLKEALRFHNGETPDCGRRGISMMRGRESVRCLTHKEYREGGSRG